MFGVFAAFCSTGNLAALGIQKGMSVSVALIPQNSVRLQQLFSNPGYAGKTVVLGGTQVQVLFVGSASGAMAFVSQRKQQQPLRMVQVPLSCEADLNLLEDAG